MWEVGRMNRNNRKHLRISKITVRNLSIDELMRVGGRDPLVPDAYADDTSHGCDTTRFTNGVCRG
jgi:hypothetical protein